MLNIDKINTFFSSSPALRLLRAKSAPLILAFFYRTFKENQVTALTEERIILNLADFLRTYDIDDNGSRENDDGDNNDNNIHNNIHNNNLKNNQETRESQLPGSPLFPDFELKAKQLITAWTEKNFLRNYENTENEIVVELTSHSEKVIQWVEQLEAREFVGTESRFKDIFNKLQELVANTTEDVEKKIRDLELQKQKIEAEIRQIQISGQVRIYDDFQIKSRLHEITLYARELLSDFKEVEDNFKTITRSIYLKHTDPEQTKGNILDYTFNALDELKDSDQGKSFYAFWEFLISQTRQDEWKILISQLFESLDERDITYDDVFLRKMKNYLYKSGQKVGDANDRMSEKLGRVISEKELAERIRVKKSINRIKELALQFINHDRPPNIQLEVEDKPQISLPLERKLTLEKPEAAVLTSLPQQAENTIDLEAISQLYATVAVDKQVLLERIHSLLQDKSQVSLKEVVTAFPIENGLSELIAYFRLVDTNDHFMFNQKTPELIEFDSDQKKYIQVPQVIFTALN